MVLLKKNFTSWYFKKRDVSVLWEKRCHGVLEEKSYVIVLLGEESYVTTLREKRCHGAWKEVGRHLVLSKPRLLVLRRCKNTQSRKDNTFPQYYFTMEQHKKESSAVVAGILSSLKSEHPLLLASS